MKKDGDAFMFFFDNSDNLMAQSDFDFNEFCNEILEECPNAKVVTTCRESVDLQKDVIVQGLVDPKQDSWNLFEQYFDKPIK